MTGWGDRASASIREGLSSVWVATALAALIVLGVLAVLVITVRGAQTTFNDAAMAVSVAEVTEEGIVTSAALQEERARASLLTFNTGPAHREPYQQAVTRTDDAFQELRVAWSQHRNLIPETATPPISDVLASEVSLTDFRQATLTPSGETTFPLYTEMVALSLAATGDLVKQSTDRVLGDRALIAALLTTSEAMQNRRYLIQTVLVSGAPISEDVRLQLDVLTNSLDQSLFEARSLASEDDLDGVQALIDGAEAAAAEAMVDEITAENADLATVSPEQWFEVSSARIEQVNELIPVVHDKIATSARETLDSAQRSLWTRSILLGALFVLSILVASNAVFATRERGEALAEYGQLADGLRQWFVASSFPDPENVDIAARYVPASVRTMSGGDWYDVYEVEGSLAIVIGDVTGHGADTTAQMAQVRNILRGQSTARTLEPAAQMDMLSKFVSEAGIVATLIYGLLDVATGEFVYTRAGHIPLLIRSGSGEVRVDEEVPGPPIGAGVDTTREQKVTKLDAGDALILITDGLVEGVDRDIDVALDRIAATLSGSDLNSEALLDTLFAMNADDPIDDAAALIVRWMPLDRQI